MAYRKRKADFDEPPKSDSDDEDYDNNAFTSSQRARNTKRTPRPKTKSRKPTKRARRGGSYGDSDGVIEDDSVSSDDNDSFGAESDADEGDEPVKVNPKTGRRVRKTAIKPKDYAESSDEEEEEEEGDGDSEVPDSEAAPPSPKVKREGSVPRKSLVVKLPVDFSKSSARNQRSTRSRTGSRFEARSATPSAAAAIGTRRSSRISHDEETDLVALTGSGRHTRIARKGTATPEPQPLAIPRSLSRTRTTRHTQGLKSYPSAIMEVSQEENPASQDFNVQSGQGDLLPGIDDYAAGADEDPKVEASDVESPFAPDAQQDDDVEEDKAESDAFAPKEPIEGNGDEDEDDDDEPVKTRGGRSLRSRAKPESPPAASNSGSRRALRPRKAGQEQSSDFEPDADDNAADEHISSSDELQHSNRKSRKSDNDSSSNGGRRSTRLAGKRGRGSQRSNHSDDAASELDLDEIADEAAELDEDRRRNKRPRRSKRTTEGITFEPTTLRNRSNRPDYRIFRPELLQRDDEETVVAPAPASQRNRRGGAAPWRSLFSTLGPFGGAGGPTPVFGGPEGTGAAAGVESDSSDDDNMSKMPRLGGTVGMTPTAAAAPMFPQTHNADPAQSTAGAPSNFGKFKDKKALADADPLGVDPNVSFEGVGGLDDHIDRLKEMVALPLLYPEVFQQFKITPPRGVLFHGPPGTGKTLLARALASSVSSQGKKVTFYMRKGADALSKWVGEAERQLRLLFEEARKNQPSIIFFDEIDGLAPVRSSKQEQIHASIVATLLALMDGMDGRGQVVVIGATNRPDSVDPALRRPGRFDREFYFPLPNQSGRLAIIDIHTKGWDPPLQPAFKDQLASLTKGYGGADLRALCTEAALNAVQGTFPQIYKSTKKLLIDPTKIRVLAKDFMISVNKIVPSSERSASSAAAPLNKSIEPLLRESLVKASALLDEIIPQKKRATALEEAMFDDRDDERGFEKETLAREFETARIFRPRLLIRGLQGMGQQYLSQALLSKFEGLHVQSFDLPTLLRDSTRSPEAAIVQLFEEVKRHKPSVIYIPDVENWYITLSDSAIKTFTGILRSLPPTDPVLLLGVLEMPTEDHKPDGGMMRDLFGYSSKNNFKLDRPNEAARKEYFTNLMQYVGRSPRDFPDPSNRKQRVLEELPEAPEIETPKGPTKAEIKAQKKRDRHTLNMLKLHIQQVMDQIKLKYRKFRTPIVDDSLIAYLYDEQDDDVVTTDLDHEQAQQMLDRPYTLEKDEKGVTGLRETATGRFYYNLEIVTIENRLSNGYYKRPKDFLADIKRLAKDARTSGDPERTLKANEMVANVEVDMISLEASQPALIAECEAVSAREQAREKEILEKAEQSRRDGYDVPIVTANIPPHVSNSTGDQSAGPLHLGENVPGARALPPFTPAKTGHAPLQNGTGGSEAPQGFHEDTEMTDSQDLSSVSNAHENKYENFALSGSDPQRTQSHTQTSAITQIRPGTDIKDYYNSASTTTSGQRTSDQSNRTSGPYTGHSNGLGGSHESSQSNVARNGDLPDFSAFLPSGGSQLPDTQPEIASSGSQASQSSPQVMGPPQHNRQSSSVHALLNEPVENYLHVIPVDPDNLHRLHTELVTKSSGLTIEQLEQVMSSLMDAIWRTKSDANRNHAAAAVSDAFNETIKDIEEYQQVLDPSQKF
ncbi:hypothetical protein AAFC00_001339 [Neodothiora populina]|uniref:AAA+ ATPase domain-containing protein n=1 Tax=Neodothiora populina TaxID=2781224 RepID=A0ABR3PNX4_9PEZI